MHYAHFYVNFVAYVYDDPINFLKDCKVSLVVESINLDKN
jgi:hypothetical protein